MYLAATPMLAVPDSRILLKLEGCNFSGSIRDRAAFHMIKRTNSDKSLLLRDWGPFALSAAWAAKLMGKKLKLILPEDVPDVFKYLLSHDFSDEITEESCELLEPELDPEHPMAYYEGLSEELWQQGNLYGKLSAVVCGTDTCATLMGCSTGLKIHDPNIMAVGAPISEEFYGNHDPLGAADPEFYVPQLCDMLSYTSMDEARKGKEWLAENMGIACGIVGGAAFVAAKALEKEVDGYIMAVLPSRFECW